MDLSRYLSDRKAMVDRALDEALPGPEEKPQVLHRAMRYSLFAGGKRIRPVLAMAAAEATNGRAEDTMPLAVALECLHTYSLIHDDLPAMDDDDLRRGQPSTHKRFGEAVAILAGDALLTFAFEHLSEPSVVRRVPSARISAVIRELAFAAGSRRLVAGQTADMEAEGKQLDEDEIDYIVGNKTAALIRASLVCGALMVGAPREQCDMLGRFGDSIGRAFQIRDDLLDLEGDPETLGKAVRKDKQRGKATYPNLFGEERSRAMISRLVDDAIRAVEPLGKRAEPLVTIAGYLGERTT